MRILILTLILLNASFLLPACSNTPTEPVKKQNYGEIVPAPEGMEEAVKQYFLNRKFIFRGMNVRTYPKDIFLVAADFEKPNPTYEYERYDVWRLKVQKAQTGGKSYWQVDSITKDEIKRIEDMDY